MPGLATFETRVRKNPSLGRAVRSRSFSLCTFHESVQHRILPGLEARETWGTWLLYFLRNWLTAVHFKVLLACFRL